MPLAKYGKLQTGQPDSFEFGFYGFEGGLNIKAAPQLLKDNELTIATNGYLRPDGAFQMRNGMNAYGAAIGAYPLFLARFFALVQGGSPVSEVRKLLGVCNGVLYSIPSTGAATNIGSVGGAAVTTVSWCRFENPNCTTAGGSAFNGLTDVIVICTGVTGYGPYIYDGTNLYSPAGWTGAGGVSGAAWCAWVNGVLWFGGIPALPNVIQGTGTGPAGDGISYEALSSTRYFNFQNPVTGLCAQGSGATATLVVAQNKGISVLYGTGYSTFFLQDIPFNDGVTSGMSMVSYNGTVYFLGRMAYYSFDGQTIPQIISTKIEPWILSDPYTPGYPLTENWNLTWACIYNNRLHLGYCSDAATPNTILCYDLLLKAWTVLVPTPGIASMCLFDAPNDPDPYTCYVGSATTGQVYQWDYVPNIGTDPVYDGATPVLAQVQSKYFKVGVPGTNKMIERFYPEFLLGGAFQTTFNVSTNYGLGASSAEASALDRVGTTFILGTSLLDMGTLGGPQSFTPFQAPSSRLDFAGVQADSFAFGVTTSTPLAPWVWSGGTGIFNQQGRT